MRLARALANLSAWSFPALSLGENAVRPLLLVGWDPPHANLANASCRQGVPISGPEGRADLERESEREREGERERGGERGRERQNYGIQVATRGQGHGGSEAGSGEVLGHGDSSYDSVEQSISISMNVMFAITD